MNCIIVSHNSRIQCLLDKLKNADPDEKIRFQNCCVLNPTGSTPV